jgi:hypothetical protein
MLSSNRAVVVVAGERCEVLRIGDGCGLSLLGR